MVSHHFIASRVEVTFNPKAKRTTIGNYILQKEKRKPIFGNIKNDPGMVFKNIRAKTPQVEMTFKHYHVGAGFVDIS